MGAKTSKTPLLPQSRLNLFNLFLNFLLSCPHKTTVLDFEILSLRFLTFGISPIVPYGETQNLNYLENERP